MRTINRKNYADVCRELGFLPESHFVQVGPGGAVGFSAGKPDEIKALAQIADRLGFRLSAGLRLAAKRCGLDL